MVLDGAAGRTPLFLNMLSAIPLQVHHTILVDGRFSQQNDVAAPLKVQIAHGRAAVGNRHGAARVPRQVQHGRVTRRAMSIIQVTYEILLSASALCRLTGARLIGQLTIGRGF